MQPLWVSPTPLPGAYGQQVVQHTGELANFILFQSRMNHLFSMVGALNKLPVAASGMIFFDDPISVPFHSIRQSRVTGPQKSTKCHDGHGHFGEVTKSFLDSKN